MRSHPMMQQYHRIKREIPPDALLLFRLGDFYELFFADAEEGSRLLGLTLTQRQGMPMCGMPYHAAEGYIAQLLQAGRARCHLRPDGSSPARPGPCAAKSRKFSPRGSILDTSQLEPKQNNFLAAIAPLGEGLWPGCPGSHHRRILCRRVSRWRNAARCADPGGAGGGRSSTGSSHRPGDIRSLRQRAAIVSSLVEHDAWSFSPDAAEHTLRDHFRVASLDGLGLSAAPRANLLGATCAAGGLIH